MNKKLSNAKSYKNYPRFRWYTYKEGFSPELVSKAINSVDIKEDDYVLDPFNGNGTVTLTSSLNSKRSVGIEVNHFSAFMSKTKGIKFSNKLFKDYINKTIESAEHEIKSPLSYFSTFSELAGKDKWLFNSSLLNRFENSWKVTATFQNKPKNLCRLALIGSIINNCNAVKDGKCLKNKKIGRQK